MYEQCVGEDTSLVSLLVHVGMDGSPVKNRTAHHIRSVESCLASVWQSVSQSVSIGALLAYKGTLSVWHSAPISCF